MIHKVFYRSLEDDMLIEVQTEDGPRKVRVCDYCRTVCIPSGRFCSGRCAGQSRDREKWEEEQRRTLCQSNSESIPS